MLIQCDECKKEISNHAKSCPYCGNPIRIKRIEKKLKSKFSTRVLIILTFFSVIFFTFMFIRKNYISQPTFIKIKGVSISYYDKKEKVDDKLNLGIEEKMLTQRGFNYSDIVKIIYNDYENIRVLDIVDERVITWKGIKVGDSLNKIKQNFKKTYERSNTYSVIYKDGKELTEESYEFSDDLIYLNYFIENNVITRIMIYDGKFAKYAK